MLSPLSGKLVLHYGLAAEIGVMVVVPWTNSFPKCSIENRVSYQIN